MYLSFLHPVTTQCFPELQKGCIGNKRVKVNALTGIIPSSFGTKLEDNSVLRKWNGLHFVTLLHKTNLI